MYHRQRRQPTRRVPMLGGRCGTHSGKYLPMDRSLYITPSSFDGTQPPHAPKYEWQVRSAKIYEQHLAPSLDHRQAARRAASAVPSSLQVMLASLVRARSARLGDLADHDAKECQELPPPLKHCSDCLHDITAS